MSTQNNNNSRIQGFTLVELSIVLIIIGFLIAGIAAGSSLIKSAQLNSVITDFRGNQTAYNNFSGRYGQAPGDFNNAFSIWGTACADVAADCNGNGNGVIDSTREVQAAWVMLSQANMISAVAPALTATLAVAAPGVNMPLSKAPGGGYMIVQGNETVAGFTNNTGLWATAANTTNVNAVIVAKPDGTSTTLLNSVYAPDDAYSIDTKIDDGLASTGNVRAGDGNDATNGATACISGEGGTYNLSVTTVTCFIAMALNQ